MYLLADVGGSNTRITVSKDGKTLAEPVKFVTPQNFSEAMNLIQESVDQVLGDVKPDRAVFAVPGVLDQTKGCLASAPNLVPWIGQPIERELNRITGGGVEIINDADLAGLGEACYGAGQAYNIVVYLTISTGIGGARIVNKKIDEQAFGFEPGWQIIDAGGALCDKCPKPTTLEDLIGGGNVGRRFCVHPKDIPDKSFWDTAAKWLAYGLNNIVALWSPDAIVIGGPMMNDIDIKQVCKYAAETIKFVPRLPDITPAALGDDRAFYGGLAWLNTVSK